MKLVFYDEPSLRFGSSYSTSTHLRFIEVENFSSFFSNFTQNSIIIIFHMIFDSFCVLHKFPQNHCDTID